MIRINLQRLLRRLSDLGQIGTTGDGGVTRLALTPADGQARDQLKTWIGHVGLTTRIDRIGNLLAVRPGLEDLPLVLMGSHLDTVHNGGRLDGSYGVLAALEVLETLRDHGVQTRRPLGVVAFTNEEGVRFAPGMLGSQIVCGGMALPDALALKDAEGRTVEEELARIGYAGDLSPTQIRPAVYLELHIEQGPILDKEGTQIGVVETVVGRTWLDITLTGEANHAGTTPISLRKDAGLVAAKTVVYLRELALRLGDEMRATCGQLTIQPCVTNAIPNQARLRIDLRHPDRGVLEQSCESVVAYALQAAEREKVSIETHTVDVTEPVSFDAGVVETFGRVAQNLGYSVKTMRSGASHDAQIMTRICRAGMLFVPSLGGFSHCPQEATTPESLARGANVLLHTALDLAEAAH